MNVQTMKSALFALRNETVTWALQQFLRKCKIETHQPKVKHYLKNTFITLTKITSLSFNRCLPELVSLSYSQERCTHFSNRLHISVTTPRCNLDVDVSNLFPCTGRLWILCL